MIGSILAVLAVIAVTAVPWTQAAAAPPTRSMMSPSVTPTVHQSSKVPCQPGHPACCLFDGCAMPVAWVPAALPMPLPGAPLQLRYRNVMLSVPDGVATRPAWHPPRGEI